MTFRERGAVRSAAIRSSLVVAAIAVFSTVLVSATLRPGRFQFKERADYRESEINGIEVTAEGALVPGILGRPVDVPDADYVWAISVLPGRIFVGTGDGGSLLEIPEESFEREDEGKAGEGGKKEKARTVWRGEGTEVYAVTALDRDHVLAGISPKGVLLALERSGETWVVRNEIAVPDSYVWKIVVVGQDLWIATGSGEIGRGGAVYRYRDGGLEEIYRTADQHVLALVLVEGKEGTEPRLFGGTEGGDGYLFKISALDAREPVVRPVFDPEQNAVMAVVPNEDGTLMVVVMGRPSEKESKGNGTRKRRTGADQAVAGPVPSKGSGNSNGATIYRVWENGDAREWIQSRTIVRAAGRTPFGFLVGTAESGNVYRIDGVKRSSLLMDLDEPNVLTIAGRYVAAGPPARIYEMVPAEGEGVLRTEALDAGGPATWGTLGFDAKGSWEIRTRSGNTGVPGIGWSGWSLPIRNSGARIESPTGRYLQIEVRHTADRKEKGETEEAAKKRDEVRDLQASYQVWNRPPEISSISIERLDWENENMTQLNTAGPLGMVVGQIAQAASSAGKKPGNERDKAAITELLAPLAGLWKVEWSAEDPDEDELTFTLELIEVQTGQVHPVAEKVRGEAYLVNTRNYPDGRYRVRLRATDAEEENGFGEPGIAEEETEEFIVDNTPPEVEVRVRVSKDGAGYAIEGVAEDGGTSIKDLWLFESDGVWRRFLPDDGICDQARETFHLFRAREEKKKGGKTGTRWFTVKAIDEAGNVGFGRAELKDEDGGR
ncbi:MAG: hypothetical protein D6679_03635 [Candidatus Hydrogenedentota bacterium]|nr:MAG: hypothetical protein D6679_03635 [Candidatus Hydrogenedentota bacterium]